MTNSSSLFQYGYRYASLVDMGKMRDSNQDAVICCPQQGFFAVSDGMGGLADGGRTSDMIARVLPGLIEGAANELSPDFEPGRAGELFTQQMGMVSDSIFETGNQGGHFSFGATVCGVWLVKDKAVFVNLGDSRGYHLPRFKKTLTQMTKDHNVAALLVENGELTKREAKNHPSSSRLTRFVGMEPPALIEMFVVDVRPGDRILLCSDGLHGMAEEEDIRRLLRSSPNPDTVCRRLIDEANGNGGRDNISAIYIKITK